ncbi:Mut7-C ubiquitin/RNAse domain-containing protein [bacterium]|nr:Mut7-C ubiquitin/RNAse domain-containing protein [bacterium]
MNEARFRFYEELNDFLPPRRRKREFAHAFRGAPAVKDAIEALGVPHVEIDLILVDGRSVDFGHALRDGQRVAVYPVFESLDISPVTRLREHPLRVPRFVCDVHLGKLARRLRILGFDTVWADDLEDAVIASVASREGRCVLTRDVGLLKRNEVTRGYWVRGTEVRSQVAEVVRRLDLAKRIEPFARCSSCNAPVEPVGKAEIEPRLEPQTREHFEEFHRCTGCGRIYWQGSHYDSLLAEIQNLTP